MRLAIFYNRELTLPKSTLFLDFLTRSISQYDYIYGRNTLADWDGGRKGVARGAGVFMGRYGRFSCENCQFLCKSRADFITQSAPAKVHCYTRESYKPV